jgi:hypothetical protein
MALKVIGSGLGRTGTLSLKLALEQLGLGPCHHMVEVFMNPQSVPLWVAAGAGQPDWNAIFGAYQSMVDYPGAKFWRQLMDFYPDAKVVHSVRDPDRWFESTQATIFSPTSPATNPPPGPMQEFFAMVTAELKGHLHDRDFMVDHFKRHTAEVLATVPKDRLLVFEAAHGWEPLCAFLGVPVPGTPFPRENSRQDFQARVSGAGSGPPDPAAIKAALEEARGH